MNKVFTVKVMTVDGHIVNFHVDGVVKLMSELVEKDGKLTYHSDTVIKITDERFRFNLVERVINLIKQNDERVFNLIDKTEKMIFNIIDAAKLIIGFYFKVFKALVKLSMNPIAGSLIKAKLSIIEDILKNTTAEILRNPEFQELKDDFTVIRPQFDENPTKDLQNTLREYNEEETKSKE